MKILRAADHKRMPWKNGGGETTEIAVFPEGAGLDDFEWRVSMARVDGDGPFSSFPGIDRTLAILEGAGIMLQVEGHQDQRLTLASEPHPFPADIKTSADLISGSVVDFNVMSRRGRMGHRVERLTSGRVSAAGPLRLVLCSKGVVAAADNAGHHKLGRHDATLLAEGEAVEITPDPNSEFYLVTFSRAAIG